MAQMLTCDIVTPEKKIASFEASMVVVPAYDGEMGILSKHAPIVTVLGNGSVRCTLENNEVERFVIDGGYVQVGNDDKVIVLADRAVKLSEIDSAALATQISELEQQIAALGEEGTGKAFLETQLDWARIQERMVSR